MPARLFRPAKTAMSSGTAKTRAWVLEFASDTPRSLDPLMGWTGGSDTQAQVRLSFDSKDAALAYAAERGLEVTVTDPHTRRPNIRPRGYGENFATDRRGSWTH
ncbi:MAG: ETC complex I subunit [Qingshengfaniella sp.]